MLATSCYNGLKAQHILGQLNDTAIVGANEATRDAAPIIAKKWNQIKTKHFTLNFGVAVFLDYSIPNQDAGNMEKVDIIKDAVEFRAQFEW